MAKQVPWDKTIVDEFIKQAMLSEDEIAVLETRVKGLTRVQQSIKLGVSVSTIDKIIKRLKIKYDNAQRHSEILPKRLNCVKELRNTIN